MLFLYEIMDKMLINSLYSTQQTYNLFNYVNSNFYQSGISYEFRIASRRQTSYKFVGNEIG
jgi:hypothetical protein